MDVIIPTRNSAPVLEPCLLSLSKQTNPVHVIIVDANSSDETKDIAKAFGCTILEEPKTNFKGSKRAVACNEGLRHVTSEFVGFLDSDTVIPETWAEEMENLMEIYRSPVVDPKTTQFIPVAAITSGCEPDTSTSLSRAKSNVMKIASNHSRKYTNTVYVNSVPGYNAVYKADAIRKVGGFSEEIGGCEDWELNNRLRNAGYCLLGVPAVPVVHKERVTYKAFQKQMNGYGWSWGRLLRVKHIFKLSRAIPSIALILLLILAPIIFYMFPALGIIGISSYILILELLPEETVAFTIMQLSLAIGYLRGLFF
jgi:GT2 family glycosyltransferase